MKLVTFTHNGETRIAALENGTLVDLHAAYKAKLTSQRKPSGHSNCRGVYSKGYEWVSTRWNRKYEFSKRGYRLCAYEKT